MALIRSILRSLLKRLQTTLAVVQRIARFLLATFRRTRSRREMWSIAETLLRSLTPEIPYGRTEEDEEETTNNTIREQLMTSSGAESDEVPRVPLAASEITSDDEEEVLMDNDNVQDSPTLSGKSLISGGEHVAEMLEEDGTRKNEVCDTRRVLVLKYNNIYCRVASWLMHWI